MATVAHPRQAQAVSTTQIPVGVLCNQDLTFGARLLYGLLTRYQAHTPNAAPNQNDLARDLGCTARAVRNYLTELRAAELLMTEPHVGNTVTRYHLRFAA